MFGQSYAETRATKSYSLSLEYRDLRIDRINSVFSPLCRDSTERGGNETHADGHPSNGNDSCGSTAPIRTRVHTCG